MSDITQTEIELLKTLLSWEQQNYRVVLVTVIATTGHTPRRLGSQFALREDGLFVGSVSGGCAEDELFSSLLEHFPTKPMTLFFGGTQKDARSALACGGEIELAIEPIVDYSDFATILKQIQSGQRVSRCYHVETGESHLLDIAEAQAFRRKYMLITLTYGCRLRLLIIGAVEISHYLVPIAKMLNYHVDVCDPRPAYQQSWPIDEIEVDTDYPDDWLRKLKVDQYCAVVALTHDPRYDDMGLMEALASSAFYVGALGSKRSTDKRVARLKQLDLDISQIKRLHGPIGLDIGSRSAAEIAVSIMAQLVKVRTKLSTHNEN